jgi:phenylacetic acid degradation operon negative regulatory protein
MTSRLPEVRSLVARFRRQQPVRAGSLIITVFGDFLAPRGGAISLKSLIELTAPFAVSERLVRTSVARLAGDGWLETRRIGRLSEYRLSPTGRQQFAEATRRIYAGPVVQWSGQWTLLLLAALPAARRIAVRGALRWEGYGEPESAVLAHPTVSPTEARDQLALAGIRDEVIILRAQTGDARADSRLVSLGWDLSELAARYERFSRGYGAIREALDRGAVQDPADAFVIRTLLIHDYRKIHLRDPLLPPALLPDGWPGGAAYELCRSIYSGLHAAADNHLTIRGETLDGALPAVEDRFYARFGGLPRPVRAP